jgi:hypothetical protein
VLSWYGDAVTVEALRARTRRLADGGTTAVHLARVALELGYRARLYPLGVRVFDPTWWELEDADIALRLHARAEGLPPGADRDETLAWRDHLRAGGYVAFHEPGPGVLVRALALGRPLICGLNATWLYREARSIPDTNETDDVHGHPIGHFVTVVGYTGHGKHFHVVDPSEDAPFDAGGARAPEDATRGRYPLPADRLIHAILLGDGTHDAVVLEVWPSPRASARIQEIP